MTEAATAFLHPLSQTKVTKEEVIFQAETISCPTLRQVDASNPQVATVPCATADNVRSVTNFNSLAVPTAAEDINDDVFRAPVLIPFLAIEAAVQTDKHVN
jgi:hypothetical protein